MSINSAYRADHGAVIIRWKERIKRLTPTPPKQDPKSYDDPAVALRVTNAGRLAAAEPPLTHLQLERQLRKPSVGAWSQKHQEFDADVEAFGSAEYMQKAMDLYVMDPPILPAPAEIGCDTPTTEDIAQQQTAGVGLGQNVERPRSAVRGHRESIRMHSGIVKRNRFPGRRPLQVLSQALPGQTVCFVYDLDKRAPSGV